jgi:hypothetical protein
MKQTLATARVVIPSAEHIGQHPHRQCAADDTQVDPCGRKSGRAGPFRYSPLSRKYRWRRPIRVSAVAVSTRNGWLVSPKTAGVAQIFPPARTNSLGVKVRDDRKFLSHPHGDARSRCCPCHLSSPISLPRKAGTRRTGALLAHRKMAVPRQIAVKPPSEAAASAVDIPEHAPENDRGFDRSHPFQRRPDPERAGLRGRQFRPVVQRSDPEHRRPTAGSRQHPLVWAGSRWWDSPFPDPENRGIVAANGPYSTRPNAVAVT